MASTIRPLRLTCLRGTYRIRPRRPLPGLFPLNSSFHSSTSRRENTPPSSDSKPPSSSDAFYESLSPPDRERYLRDVSKINQLTESLSSANAAARIELEEDDEPPERTKPGLMNMGEVDEFDQPEDEVFQGDDMTSLAHGELEQHRELREYARIAAWEMPLLSKLSTPFSPPPSSHPLRFRHTTYLGETHPASSKIVLEFCTGDLPLTPSQRLALVKLLGVRYNPQTDIAHLSCEMFGTSAQNKRYLGDLVDTLMSEARESEKKFEDVPVDFRHVKWKEQRRFPEAWKIKGDGVRRVELERLRGEGEERERRRIEEGLLVDGPKLIEMAMRRAPVEEVARVEATRVRRLGGSVGGKGDMQRRQRMR